MQRPGPIGFLLEGWENRSVWGWDEGTGSWWVQLWRNGLPSDPVADAPHVSIGPLAGQHISAVSGLVPLIAAATGQDADHIDQLLAESMR
ncbi:hypothetical protein ACGFI3_46290 [Nonomuraea wenchangensis]|uniref:hypothetical protein n=1 Tax=Nonomuraea wenchangensis TaxID=568860 RepID=UPI003722F637